MHGSRTPGTWKQILPADKCEELADDVRAMAALVHALRELPISEVRTKGFCQFQCCFASPTVEMNPSKSTAAVPSD